VDLKYVKYLNNLNTNQQISIMLPKEPEKQFNVKGSVQVYAIFQNSI